MSDLFTRLAQRALDAPAPAQTMTVRSPGWFGPIGDATASDPRTGAEGVAPGWDADDRDPAGEPATSARLPFDAIDPDESSTRARERPATIDAARTSSSRSPGMTTEADAAAWRDRRASRIGPDAHDRVTPGRAAAENDERRDESPTPLDRSSSLRGRTRFDESTPATLDRNDRGDDSRADAARRHDSSSRETPSVRAFSPLVPIAVAPSADAALASALADLAAATSRRSASTGPVVRVTIGRVEVRAALPAAEPAPRPRREPAERDLSLADYLTRRRGARR